MEREEEAEHRRGVPEDGRITEGVEGQSNVVVEIFRMQLQRDGGVSSADGKMLRC